MKNEVLGKFIVYMNKAIYRERVNYLKKEKWVQDHKALPGILTDAIMPDGEMIPGHSLKELIESESLKNALQTLEQREIDVLFRVVCQRESVESVAEDLGIHRNSISRIKHRALQKLRKALMGGVVNG